MSHPRNAQTTNHHQFPSFIAKTAGQLNRGETKKQSEIKKYSFCWRESRKSANKSRSKRRKQKPKLMKWRLLSSDRSSRRTLSNFCSRPAPRLNSMNTIRADSALATHSTAQIGQHFFSPRKQMAKSYGPKNAKNMCNRLSGGYLN